MKLTSIFASLISGVFLGTSCLFLPTSAAAETHTVVVRDPEFDPSFLPDDVSIQEGDTVRFEWSSANVDEHNVVAGTLPGTTPAPYQNAFRSQIAITGYIFDVVFDRDFLNEFPSDDDNYHYFCGPHFLMGMAGVVRVTRVAKPFKATAVGWQAVPANSSTQTSTCDITLSADENSVDVSCTHSLTGFSFNLARNGLARLF